MKLKFIGWVFLALLALLLVVPFLIPMQSYRHQIEQTASSKLGVPVTIESLRIALLPSPRVNVGGIVVGGNAEVMVADVSAVLDIVTLFDKIRVVSRLEVNQPVLKQAALKIIQGIKLSDETTVVVRHVEVDDAKLEWQGLSLPVLNAEIAMSDAGKLQKAIFKSADGKLTIETTPKDDGYAAHIQAQQWVAPINIPVMFDTLNVDLKYSGQALDFPKIEATLYRGKLNGAAHLDWSKDWHLAGKFNSQNIELGDASKLFTKAVKVSGRISGSGGFTSQAKEAGELVDSLVLDYAFNVANGVLHGVDLVKAASMLVRQGQTGGETHFDELAGNLHTKGKLIELRQLHVSSGLLKAQGHLKVSPDKKLAGNLEVEIKQSALLVDVPLEVSGTLDAPSVMPTKAALFGAVAGTAVLGPAGTALGVKAAGALDKLFGGKK